MTVYNTQTSMLFDSVQSVIDMTNNRSLEGVGGADLQDAAELDGLKVVFTGRLSQLTRKGCTQLVEEHGGKVTNNISHQSDLLVVGENPGTEKTGFFKQNDIASLTESEFYALFEEDLAASTSDTEDTDHESIESYDDLVEVTLTIDPLFLAVAEMESEQNSDNFESFVEDATRSMLKRVIDGDEVSTTTGSEGKSVEITLPSDLVSMVETATGMVAELETTEEFVEASVSSAIGFDSSDECDLEISLPNGVVRTIEELATEDGCETNELVSELLIGGLRDRLSCT